MTIVKHMPYRWLRLTSPYMEGPDVEAVQVGLSKRLKARGKAGIKADGTYGPKTRDALRSALWWMGCPSDDLDLCGLTRNQSIVRDPDNRPSHWFPIARDRQDWLKDQSRGGDGFVDLLQTYIGKVEQPKDSNRGAWLDPLHRGAGFAPESHPPYCAIGLIACFRRVGLEEVKNAWAYTPSWVYDIRSGSMGWKDVKMSSRKPGDVFFIKIPGVSNDVCDHVGAIEDSDSTIEFNTSSGRSGSQNNGGGVWRRNWADRDNMTVCIGRPPWNN